MCARNFDVEYNSSVIPELPLVAINQKLLLGVPKSRNEYSTFTKQQCNVSVTIPELNRLREASDEV